MHPESSFVPVQCVPTCALLRHISTSGTGNPSPENYNPMDHWLILSSLPASAGLLQLRGSAEEESQNQKSEASMLELFATSAMLVMPRPRTTKEQ